jgi:hypothetical protein
LRRKTIQGFVKLCSIEDSAVRTFRKNDTAMPPIDASKQPLLRICHRRHDSNSENVALLKKISERNVKGRSRNRITFRHCLLPKQPLPKLVVHLMAQETLSLTRDSVSS